MSEVRKIVIATLVCLAVVTAVLVIAWPGSAKSQVRLLVHAGAGIQPPLDELAKLFTSKSGVRVDYSYKGSGCLLPDIVLSRRGDLYIPGELFYMQQAVERGMIKSYRPVAEMSTVIIAQGGNPKRIAGLKDLAKPGMRVGLGDAEAIAIGRAARKVLDKAGLRKQVEKNLVMSCMNVVELGNAVKLGHLDAAIVWDGTAALYRHGEVTAIAIPAAYRVTTSVPAGVTSCSKHPQEAAQFLAFLASKEAAPVFRKHGYSVPEKAVAEVAKGNRP
jgi:molybdate transport system substrate-binding protein